jgi:hypothetical protein
MIRLELFPNRLESYRKLNYNNSWNGFWNWKVEVESGTSHILDESHFDDTYLKLKGAMKQWLTYRPFDVSVCLGFLEMALKRITSDYYNIKSVSLMDFPEASKPSFRNIWGK